jgi:hypothetical protein
MTESALLWMNKTYPQGFFCCDLKHLQTSEGFWVDVVALNCPLLIHLQLSELQATITGLIDAGASATTPCNTFGDPMISGTLGDIAMKLRSLDLKQFDLAVEL